MILAWCAILPSNFAWLFTERQQDDDLQPIGRNNRLIYFYIMPQIMKSNRRSFLKQSSSVMLGCSFNINNESSFKAPFVHHALFWLKDKDNKENYTHMFRFLKKFKEVKGVKFLHVGTPSISDIDYEAHATDFTYTFSYLALFDSKKDKEDYLKHPLHTQFFSDFKDVVSKVIIYDSLNIAD